MGCCNENKPVCGRCGAKLKRVYVRGRLVIVCTNRRCPHSRPR